MRKIEEIERQIQALSAEEYAELREWFLEQDWKDWDAKVAADANAGKLDVLVHDEGVASKKMPDDFAKTVGRALRRAGKEARKTARMYGTPIYVWENGKVLQSH